MANKAKHAHGSRANLNTAITNKVVDTFDVLFLSGENENPAMGWLDKDGNPIILSPADEVAKLETQVEAKLATKANAEEIEAKIAIKANAEDVQSLEDQIATKADSAEVDAKIDKAALNSVATAKSYTDGKIEAAINEHMIKKYEITSVPEGTLVDYRDKEIRVMCPTDTKWVKQTVGSTGNANMYYMGFKAYAPEGAVGFKEGDRGIIVDEMFDFNGDFAGTDEYGRNYSICWLALASYDESTDTWTYFGKNSKKNKYIGWTYVVEWYNADGVVIASDSVRINLSNENCHSLIEPYYVGTMMTEVETKIEEKIAEVNSAYEVIEF